jgi:hypothetical protein
MESRTKTTHAGDFLHNMRTKRLQDMEQNKAEADNGCIAKFFGKKTARFFYGVDEDQIHMLRAQLREEKAEKKPEPSLTEKVTKQAKKAKSYLFNDSAKKMQEEKKLREEARAKYPKPK